MAVQITESNIKHVVDQHARQIATNAGIGEVTDEMCARALASLSSEERTALVSEMMLSSRSQILTRRRRIC